MNPNTNQGTGTIPYGPAPKPKKPAKPKVKVRAHKPKAAKPKKPKSNPRLTDPARFTAPRSLNQVTADAGRSANLRYGGQERDLAQQSQQVPAWFAAYRAQVQGIGQGIQQGYQQGANDVIARQQQTAASDTTARNSLASTMGQSAASRGATVDPSLLAGDVNAANVRNTNQAAFANLLGAQAQAQGAYFGGLQTAGSSAELGQNLRVAKEKAGVATDKGNYKSQYVSDQRENERKYGLEKAAFGLDVAKVQTDAAVKTANNKRTTATQRANSRRTARTQRAAARQRTRDKNQDQALARKKFGSAQEKDAYERKHRLGPYKPPAAGKGAGGLTPAQRQARSTRDGKRRDRIETATQLYDQYRKTVIKRNGKPDLPTPADTYAKLIGEGYSKVEVDLARDRLRNGGRLSARGLAVAKSHGIWIPRGWRPKPKPRQHFHGTRGG